MKQVIWRFRICNYFHEIIKFSDFMDNDIFHEIIIAFIKIAKFKYFTQKITYSKSPNNVLQSCI